MRQNQLYVRSKRQYEVVPVGFSWGALLLGPLWCAVNGQFLRYLGIITVSLMPLFLALLFDGAVRDFLAMVGLFAANIGHIYFSVRVNWWREESLCRRGYTLVATITGHTPRNALEKWSKSDEAIEFLSGAT